MSRTLKRWHRALCALALLLPAATVQPAGGLPGARIQLEPPRLALLARHVGTLGSAAAWDFASITLDALLESYQEALQRAARERASTDERRAKLVRWRHATADLAAQIQAARLRLLDGAPFSVYADPQHQVLIVVDGRPIAVSGPSADADRMIDQRVVERFCAYNDCSPLASNAAGVPVSRLDRGASWLLGQATPPAYEIDGVMRCEFSDISGRERKALACRHAADEALGLAAALQTAQRRGHRVDWDWLAARPPSRASEDQVVVNSDGAYLPLPSDMLTRIPPDDWRKLVAWLQAHASDRRQVLVLRQADSLLGQATAIRGP